MSILSERIKEKRKERGWKQQDLADQTRFSLDTIKSWESGRAVPKYESMMILCRKLHTTKEYLLGGTDTVKEWLKAYDTTHCEELEKISLDVRFLECCDFLGCDTSQLDEDQADELITTSYDFIISKYKEITTKETK